MEKLILLLYLLSFYSFSQENKKPDFYYDVKSHIKSSNHFDFELQPIRLGYAGEHFTMGIGTKLEVVDIFDKLSFSASYGYNYFNYKTNKNKLRFTNLENSERLKSNRVNFQLGYNIHSSSEISNQLVTVKKKGDTEFVTEMPSKSITNYHIILGYNTGTYYSTSEGNIQSQYTNSDGQLFYSTIDSYIHFIQRNSNISLGVKRRISTHSLYNTDIYGIVSNSKEQSISFELLIGIPSTINSFNKLLYENSTYPGEVSSTVAVNSAEKNSLEEIYRYLPAGVKFKYATATRLKHNSSWFASLELTPGRYNRIQELISLELGVAYRFTKVLK